MDAFGLRIIILLSVTALFFSLLPLLIQGTINSVGGTIRGVSSPLYEWAIAWCLFGAASQFLIAILYAAQEELRHPSREPDDNPPASQTTEPHGVTRQSETRRPARTDRLDP
jgi:hypothetical protein